MYNPLNEWKACNFYEKAFVTTIVLVGSLGFIIGYTVFEDKENETCLSKVI